MFRSEIYVAPHFRFLKEERRESPGVLGGVTGCPGALFGRLGGESPGSFCRFLGASWEGAGRVKGGCRGPEMGLGEIRVPV